MFLPAMRRARILFAFTLLPVVFLMAASPSPTPDRPKEISNAVVGFKVLFRNSKDEILLVYDDRRQAWEVPGATQQGDATVRNVVDVVANELGVPYAGLRLGGLFTYHNPQTGTTIVRPYYTAKVEGSKNRAKSKWFSLAEAKKVIPYLASVQIIEKLSRDPNHVWGAAFEEYGYTSPMLDRSSVKFRVLEDFYVLK
jgi:hypothetical protein